jgi:hypothetical protein
MPTITITSAARRVAGDDARLDGRVELNPLPIVPGDPPATMLPPDGAPPDGLTFLGVRRTVGGWLYPCPHCCRGWTVLAPTEDGYAIDLRIGCSRHCDPALIHHWHQIRNGVMPDPSEADERGRRYAADGTPPPSSATC